MTILYCMFFGSNPNFTPLWFIPIPRQEEHTATLPSPENAGPPVEEVPPELVAKRQRVAERLRQRAAFLDFQNGN